MTIGSAALLPGIPPQAPLSPFPPRRGRRPSATPGTGAMPPWRLPRVGLADDPPRGRILLVEDDASLALDLQRRLHEAGYRTIGPAACLEEVERLMAHPAIDAALVDLQLPGNAAFAIAERLSQGGIPVVYLTDPSAPPMAVVEAPAVARSFSREQLIEAIKRAMAPEAPERSPYPVPPPQTVWPRVFPSL